jgi:predicted esterase
MSRFILNAFNVYVPAPGLATRKFTCKVRPIRGRLSYLYSFINYFALAAVLCVGVSPARAESPVELKKRLEVLRKAMEPDGELAFSTRTVLDTSDYVLKSLSGPRTVARTRIVKGKRVTVRVPVASHVNAIKDTQLVAELMATLEKGEDPFASRTGDMHLAFRSPSDGSFQPFRLIIPAGFDRQKQYPLVIALHGQSGNENTYPDRYVSRDSQDRMFEKLGRERGYILVSPWRRKAPSGDSAVDVDVLELVDRVSAMYPVRADQVFLTGHSSGGMGTWQVGYRHPERFAGLAAVGSAFSAVPMMMDRMKIDQFPTLPHMYVQGRRDRLSTNAGARNLVSYLQPRLSNFVYKEFPDAHGSLGVTSMPVVFDFFDAIREGRELMPSDEVSKYVAPAAVKRTVRRKKPVAKRAAKPTIKPTQ